jgi:hypothetical protein
MFIPGRALVPALESCTSSPDSRSARRVAASGERHTLPVHTVKMLSTKLVLDPLALAAKAICATRLATCTTSLTAATGSILRAFSVRSMLWMAAELTPPRVAAGAPIGGWAAAPSAGGIFVS